MKNFLPWDRDEWKSHESCVQFYWFRDGLADVYEKGPLLLQIAVQSRPFLDLEEGHEVLEVLDDVSKLEKGLFGPTRRVLD